MNNNPTDDWLVSCGGVSMDVQTNVAHFKVLFFFSVQVPGNAAMNLIAMAPVGASLMDGSGFHLCI